MYEDILITLGLNPEETEMYLSLLEHGTQGATQLSKTTHIKRTYVYPIARSLTQKGLVSQTIRNHVALFTPLSPDRLLALAQEKKQRAQQAEHSLDGILSSLKEKYQAIDTKPIITSYEGVEGVKKIFHDIYAPKNEPVYGCVDLKKSEEALSQYIIKDLIPLRIKNNVHAKTLLADSPQAKELTKIDKESLRESMLIDTALYPIPAEIDVYEDKVALLSFAKGQFVGVLIQNKDIAQSMKSLFKLAMEHNKS